MEAKDLKAKLDQQKKSLHRRQRKKVMNLTTLWDQALKIYNKQHSNRGRQIGYKLNLR